MKTKLVAIGKLKEKYLIQGINEYLKCLNSYAKMETIGAPDEKVLEKLSDAEMLQVKEREGQRIPGKISDSEYAFVLTINDKRSSSEKFSGEIGQSRISGKSNLTLVIDGSLGLSDLVLQQNNQQISFGRLTYPHQLMCLVLMEQIYRGSRIMKEEPYHKQEVGWLLSKLCESGHCLKNIQNKISLVCLLNRK